MSGAKAKLVFLSGSKSGTTLELKDSTVTIGRKPDRTVAFAPEDALVSTEHASISSRNGQYVLRDDGSRNGTFVNSQLVKEHVLQHGDVIQLGPGGPSIRFVQETKPGSIATVDVSAVAERQGAAIAAAGGEQGLRTRDLVVLSHAKLSTRMRRNLVSVLVLVVIATGVLLWTQQRNRARVEEDLANLAASVASSQSSVEQDVNALQARYAVLRDAVASEGKTLGGHGARVGMEALSDYTRGVALIVYSYGYVRPHTTDPLRYVVDAHGEKEMMRLPDGRSVPRVSFEGSGAPVEHSGTATGFLVDSNGYLLTNRWVTEPWVSGGELEQMRSHGLAIEGHMMDMRAYLPPGDQSFALYIDRKSDSADVAVLRLVGKPKGTPIIVLAPDTALVRPGDQLLTIEYPPTATDLLFRVDSTERNDLLTRYGANTPKLVEELARRRMIQPVIGDGSVTTTTSTEVTHTAGAKVGGTGGPLIDAHRRAVAIQRAAAGAAGAEQMHGVRVAYARDILPSRVQRSPIQ